MQRHGPYGASRASGSRQRPRPELSRSRTTWFPPTTISVPDAFGALILKAAAHKADTRDRERHLTDAAVLLACVDPFEERTPSGSDRSRLLHLRAHLADPTAPA
jgi:hypothetical protein